jgi:predicted Fe-Mo cluster-binding NifX family protein
MRIAIAADDGEHVAAHTGRCRGFVIFEVAGQEATRVEYRPNAFTAHARGECHEDHTPSEPSSHGSHGPLVDALNDCRVLVTRGLGLRLVADLAARQIDAYVCVNDRVDEAAALYAQGRLPRAAGRTCGCR